MQYSLGHGRIGRILLYIIIKKNFYIEVFKILIFKTYFVSLRFIKINKMCYFFMLNIFKLILE